MREIKLEPQEYLSPTSINQYLTCPRGYYYQYIAKIKPEKNVHLVRGSVVHKVLEEFFGKKYRPDLDSSLLEMYQFADKEYESDWEDLELDEEELKKEKKLTLDILFNYLRSFRQDMDALVEQGKAQNDRHAYYLLRPTFREKYLENDDLMVRGYVDKIHKDWDDNIIIGDYKTSSKYGIGLPQDYKRQVAIYSLLYYLEENVMPAFAAVIYLRYGKEILVEVTPSLLDYARDIIEDVYAKTRSTDIKDYPLSPKEESLEDDDSGSPCRWCPHPELCLMGDQEETKEQRQDRMIELLGLDKDEES